MTKIESFYAQNSQRVTKLLRKAGEEETQTVQNAHNRARRILGLEEIEL